MKVLTNRVYKVRNRVDKDKALGIKKPIMSKGVEENILSDLILPGIYRVRVLKPKKGL